jgi:hypothetical protein
MGRLFIFLGIILIIAISIAFAAAMIGMESEQFASFFEPYVCNSEESFAVILGPRTRDFDGDVSQSVNMVCQVNDANQRNVTGKVLLVVVGGFVGGLLLGIVLTIVGSFIAVRNQTKRFTGMMQSFNVQPGQANVIDLRGKRGAMSMNEVYGNIPPESAEMVQSVLQSITRAMGSMTGDTLAERLSQLEEARQQGLISQSEYDRIREALLDKMDD